MAIYPNSEGYSQGVTPAATLGQPVNAVAWTAQIPQVENDGPPSAAHGGVQGTSVSLSIDLDERAKANKESKALAIQSDQPPRQEPIRRDSLRHREALLKGKEGSRRRTRWENDRLLNNPFAQPPLPSDWEVYPTHPRHNVPYYLAPLWDHKMALKTEAEKKEKVGSWPHAQKNDESLGKVPRQLREKLKKTKAAKGLLKDLEEQVRLFVKNWNAKTKSAEQLELDSEDDDIVFVGRNGQMPDVPPSPKFRDGLDEEDFETNQLVFDSLANDQGASFGRWLVHSIASYYGLHTWSITVGDPARREAYVGIPPAIDSRRKVTPSLLRPLYGMV